MPLSAGRGYRGKLEYVGTGSQYDNTTTLTSPILADPFQEATRYDQATSGNKARKPRATQKKDDDDNISHTKTSSLNSG